MKKYELTDETRVINGIVLHRIRALISIPSKGVRPGDLGGLIEKEENLSHEWSAWIGGNAAVFGDACVTDDAWVSGYALIGGSNRICQRAQVFGNAKLFDDTDLYEDMKLSA